MPEKRYDDTMIGGGKREPWGAMLTFESESGARLTLHREGKPLEAVKEMCAIALARDESFRVVSYSTPETILTDLSGGRADFLSRTRADGLHEQQEHGSRRPLPEAIVLSRAGLLNLLHPRLAQRRSQALLREV